MSSLSALLADKIKAQGLNNTKAAEAIGVSLPSFRSVLSGKSVPNKRSVDRYAKFLGITVADILSSKSEKKAGKKAGAKKGKPGRPKGTGKPGRPKGAAKPGRPAKAAKKSATGSVSGVIDQMVSLLGAAEELLSDELAITVHNLDKRTREKIAFLLG